MSSLTFWPRNLWATSSAKRHKVQFSSAQSLSRVRLPATPWTASCQASLSVTNSGSLLKFMSIESVMPSNHLTLCHPLLLLPSVLPSIKEGPSQPKTMLQTQEFECHRHIQRNTPRNTSPLLASHYIGTHLCAQVFSRMGLFETPWTVTACQAPLSMRFPRQGYYSRLPFPPSGDLPELGIEPLSPESLVLTGGFFAPEPPGKPLM